MRKSVSLLGFLIVSLVLTSMVGVVSGDVISYEDGVQTIESDDWTMELWNYPTLTPDEGELQGVEFIVSNGQYPLRAISDNYDVNFRRGADYSLVYEEDNTRTQLKGLTWADRNITASNTITNQLPVRTGLVVGYEDVLLGSIDLELKVLSDGVKETFILPEPEPEYYTSSVIGVKTTVTTTMRFEVNETEVPVDGWVYDTRLIKMCGSTANWTVQSPFLYDNLENPYLATFTVHRTGNDTYNIWLETNTTPLQEPSKYPFRLDPPIIVYPTGQTNLLRASAYSSRGEPYGILVGDEVIVGYKKGASPPVTGVITTGQVSNHIYRDVIFHYDIPGYGSKFIVVGYSLVLYVPVVELWEVGDTGPMFVQEIATTYTGTNHRVILDISLDNQDEDQATARYILMGSNDFGVMDQDCYGNECYQFVDTIQWDDFSIELECGYEKLTSNHNWQIGAYSNMADLAFFGDRNGHIMWIDLEANTDTSCVAETQYTTPITTLWRPILGASTQDIDGGAVGGSMTGQTATDPHIYLGGKDGSNVGLVEVVDTSTQTPVLEYSITGSGPVNGLDVGQDGDVWVSTQDSLVTSTGWIDRWSSDMRADRWSTLTDRPMGIALTNDESALIAGYGGQVIQLILNEPPQSQIILPLLEIYPAYVGGSPYGVGIHARTWSNEIELHTQDIWVNATQYPYTNILESSNDIITSSLAGTAPNPLPGYQYWGAPLSQVLTYPGTEDTYNIHVKSTDPEDNHDVLSEDQTLIWVEDPTMFSYPPAPSGSTIQAGTYQFSWLMGSYLQSYQYPDHLIDDNVTVRLYQDDVLVDTLELTGAQADGLVDVDLDEPGVWRVEAQGYHHRFYEADGIGDWSTGQSNLDVLTFTVWDTPEFLIDTPLASQVFEMGSTLFLNTTLDSINPPPLTETVSWELDNQDVPYSSVGPFSGEDITLDTLTDLAGEPGNWTITATYHDGYGPSVLTRDIQLWDTWIVTELLTPINSHDYYLGDDVELTQSSDTSYILASDNWTWVITDLDTSDELTVYGEAPVLSSLSAGNYTATVTYFDGYKSIQDTVAIFTILNTIIEVNITSPTSGQSFSVGDVVPFRSDYETNFGSPILNWTWTVINTDTTESWSSWDRNWSTDQLTAGDYTVSLVFGDGLLTTSQSRTFKVLGSSPLSPGGTLDDISDWWASLGQLQYVLIAVVGAVILVGFMGRR